MKKRIVTTILMLCMAFCLCACGGNGGSADTEKDTEKKNTESSQVAEDSETEESEAVEDGKIVYTVKVVDEGGNPVANAMVQVCDAGSVCFAPSPTNAEGVAEFKLAEAEGYKTKLVTNPAGYEAVETDYVSFESGETEVTLTVKAVQ